MFTIVEGISSKLMPTLRYVSFLIRLSKVILHPSIPSTHSDHFFSPSTLLTLFLERLRNSLEFSLNISPILILHLPSLISPPPSSFLIPHPLSSSLVYPPPSSSPVYPPPTSSPVYPPPSSPPVSPPPSRFAFICCPMRNG